jgi:hypothetical protein
VLIRKSTATSTPGPTTFPPSSSTPVGGIVGGVIGATVVIGVAFAFAWYKIKIANAKEVTKGPTFAAPKGDLEYQAPPETDIPVPNEMQEVRGPPALNYTLVTDSGNLGKVQLEH